MQKFVIYICVLMIFIAMFNMLTPTGNMKKIMKLVLNLFLVCSLAMPIIKNFNCLNLIHCFGKLGKNTQISEQINDSLKDMDKNRLKNALNIVLVKNGYNCVDISIDINKDDSSKTSIYLKIPRCKNYDCNNIKQVVEKETGLTPKIGYHE